MFLLCAVLLSVLQVPGGRAPAVDEGVGAMLWVQLIFILVFSVIIIAGMWKAFEKAGQPGWAAIIPFYNYWVLVQIAQKEPIWFVMMLIPCVNIIAMIVVCIEIANKFGQGGGFGIGLAFLGFIFWPILGFGSAQYEGKRRRSSRYDDDDDDRPRGRRGRDDDDDDDRPRGRRGRDDDDDDDDRRISRRPRDDD